MSHLLTNKHLQFGLIFVVGVLLARLYYPWLLQSDLLKPINASARYWGLMLLPFVVSVGPLSLVAQHGLQGLPVKRAVALALATATAGLVAMLGLFGDLLLCLFVTRGSCS